MKKLSNSTRLINVLIGLSIPNPQYRPVLYERGYQLEYIEPHFTDTNGKLVNPDLQCKSHEEKNLVFFECKLGAIEHEQALKYKGLTKEDIVNSNITSLDMSKCQFEIIYFCDENSKEKVKKGDEIHKYGFPILSCNENSISLEVNNIKGKVLNQIFSEGVKIPDKPPLSFYPFGPDDKERYVAPAIFQSLFRFCGVKVEFNEEDILRDSHPVYDSIHKDGQKKLKEIVGKIMNDLNENEFKDVIKKFSTTHRYRINPRTQKKFRDLCLKKMEEYEKEEPQTNLSDFSNK
ncbi:MAG: hypothetical protein MSIBF_05855 [Candidatus Altiarchaeales archaeon IMC4]|nr:MAG: hypothetical protein MSIBF_05855 [Candidatus Altiarchaeales archaeon IMC4]